MTLADRIVVLNGGVIEQVGTPDQLYAAPDTLFVAGFVGAPTMNLLPATIAEAGPGGASVRLPGGQVIATTVSTTLSAGTAVTLGIRPEHVRAEGTTNRLSGEVRMVESIGSAHHVHLAVEGLADPLVASLAERPTSDTLTLSLPRDAILLFDGEGRALGRDTAPAPRIAA
jgi:multiple sugar transport system ATP-binding protein